MNENSLNIIKPYRFGGTWVFDDPKTGLTQEPFVFGMPEIFDQLVDPYLFTSFTMIFSCRPFPFTNLTLTHVREDKGGNWYKNEHGQEGWLCPALYKYFEKAPEHIYAKVTPNND